MLEYAGIRSPCEYLGCLTDHTDLGGGYTTTQNGIHWSCGQKDSASTQYSSNIRVRLRNRKAWQPDLRSLLRCGYTSALRLT